MKAAQRCLILFLCRSVVLVAKATHALPEASRVALLCFFQVCRKAIARRALPVLWRMHFITLGPSRAWPNDEMTLDRVPYCKHIFCSQSQSSKSHTWSRTQNIHILRAWNITTTFLTYTP